MSNEQQHMPVQFGMVYSADFEANTLTLEMQSRVIVAAGQVAVVPKEAHDGLTEAIKRLLVCMRLAGWGNDPTAEFARAALARATHTATQPA